MKKISLILVLACISALSFSQVCTPLTPQQCPDPEGNGELCPDWIIFTETVPFSDAITILPPPTADGGVIGMVNINWIQITQINNMPQNSSYTCAPANCQFNSGTYYCIAMAGTAPAGSFGKYILDIVLDANVTMQSFPYVTSTQSNQHQSFTVYCAKNQHQPFSLGNDTVILPTDSLVFKLDTSQYIATLWNGTEYNYKHTFHGSIGNGIYNLSVKALDTLSWKWVTDTITITVTPNVGVTSLNSKEFISVYPNPSTGLIQVEFGENSVSSYDVEIFNSNNQLVYSANYNVNGKSIMPINLSDKPKGVYYFRVSNNKTIRLGKILLM